MSDHELQKLLDDSQLAANLTTNKLYGRVAEHFFVSSSVAGRGVLVLG